MWVAAGIAALILFGAVVTAPASESRRTPENVKTGTSKETGVYVTVLPQEPSSLVIAGEELAGYLGRTLNARVPFLRELPSAGASGRVFLLATPVSAPALPQMLARCLDPADLSALGSDGCLAVCERPVLLLAGNTGRGAANAVWKYLEEYCNVGFFWDADHVSPLAELPFDKVRFREVPRFPERYMTPPGGYTLSEHMDWPDWKREIDWRVHKRQNLMWGPAGDFVWKEVFAEIEGREHVPSDVEARQEELNRQVSEWMRARGLMRIMPGFLGEVPAAFVARHPDVRYVGGLRWGDFPMNKHVYPSDPMFHELTVRYIRAYRERYGDAEFYFVPPYPEASPGDTEEEQRRIKVDLAAAVQRARDEAAPEMIWLADSWAFLNTEFWFPPEVRAFCGAISDRDRFRIYDTWGEERPMWSLHNAFWGLKWTFGVLHCFGANTTLHGDLRALVQDVQRVAEDPFASECTGLYIVPEALHHNDLYFDLAMRLGWNPGGIPKTSSGIDLNPFLREYAARRYGPESAPRMMRALRILADTVYATKDMTQPLYLHQLFTIFDFPNASVYAPPEQVAQTSALRKALQTAIEEAPRQMGNPLFERDLVDIARRYLGDIFNGVAPDVIYAWRAEDPARFRQAAQDAETLVEAVAQVLAASPQYRLETRTQKSRDWPNHEELVRQSRNVMSIWEGSANLDYVRRDDFAELVQGYYLPRLKIWLTRLEHVRPTIWSAEDDAWLTETYWNLGKTWVERGAAPPVAEGSVSDAIQRVLPVAQRIERRLLPVSPEPTNLDFARGLSGWSLSSRRMHIEWTPVAPGNAAKALYFRTWPDSSGGNLYVFQTIVARDAVLSLDAAVQPCGESAFAGLRVEGYDDQFRRVVECTYQWGDAWDCWPDRHRPDNAVPEWNVGPTGYLWWWVGHHTIKKRLGRGSGDWQHIEAHLSRDVDGVHGAGTWARLRVRKLRIALLASSRRKEDPLSGAFANLRVQSVR